MEKLHLEDALEDSPQTRSLLSVFEDDSALLRGYVLTLHRCCNRVLTAHRELCAAMQFLSAHLKSYNHQDFPLEPEDSILSSVLSQFATYIDEMSSIQQVLVSQLGDNMMHPVNRFLTADLDDHERALTAYMKYSKKREHEKGHQEAVDDLYVSRKKFHQTALHYFALLNTLQYKRKSALLEPLIGIMQAQKTFFEMGHEATSRSDVNEFVANIGASVQGVHNEQKEESQRRVEQIENIEQQSIHKYYAEMPVDVPYVPPNTGLSQKAGYLFLRSKQSLLTTRWDRFFFFIQGGNLMSQSREEVAGSSLMDLNVQTRVEQADVDDRRYVFHVFQPSTKKSLYLQAENARERDEWMATISNVVGEGQRLESSEVPLTPKTPTESSFSQSLLSSIPVAIPKVVEALRESSGFSRSSHPATPPSTPADGGFCPDSPIQFDLTSPDEESNTSLRLMSGPTKRINPFDQMADSAAVAEDVNSDSSKTFTVQFLGSQQVITDRGENLVRETIRQVMAARAIHNVFKMSEFQLVISRESVRLTDEFAKIRLLINLEHISYWAVHHENKRWFGFITRTPGATEIEHSTFACYVFQCNSSGEEICHTLAAATQLAFQAFMQKKAQEMEQVKEKELLLANIQQLPDQSSDPKLSADGQFVILDDQLVTPAASNTSAPPAGDNDITVTAEVSVASATDDRVESVA